MLYDPKWERRPSIAGFRAWLEQQPRDEKFMYTECNHCAVGQYLRSVGTTWFELFAEDGQLLSELNGFPSMAVHRNRSHRLSFADVLREMDDDEKRRSFGKALA